MSSKFETILILDFGSQYTQLIGRRIREANVYTEIVPFNTPLETIEGHATERHHPLRRPGFGLRERMRPLCDPAYFRARMSRCSAFVTECSSSARNLGTG